VGLTEYGEINSQPSPRGMTGCWADETQPACRAAGVAESGNCPGDGAAYAA